MEKKCYYIEQEEENLGTTIISNYKINIFVQLLSAVKIKSHLTDIHYNSQPTCIRLSILGFQYTP